MENHKINWIKRKICTIILIFILLGCSNDDSGFTFKNEYKSTRIELSKIRIFTQQGEIVDRNAYQAVLKRHSELTKNTPNDELSFLKKDKIVKTSETQYLKFKDKIATIGDTKTEKKYTYKVSGNFVRFIGKDTLRYSGNFSTHDNFINNIILHKPINNKVPIIFRLPGSIGISKVYGYILERYARLHSSTVRFPLLTFNLYQSSGVRFSSFTYRINNEFNENIYKHLSVSDTLLVQQNWMVFE